MNGKNFAKRVRCIFTKKMMVLLFVLVVLGVSIMAIIIHSKNIYDKKNDKVIDNQISKVEYTENKVDSISNGSLYSTKPNVIVSYNTNTNTYEYVGDDSNINTYYYNNTTKTVEGISTAAITHYSIDLSGLIYKIDSFVTNYKLRMTATIFNSSEEITQDIIFSLPLNSETTTESLIEIRNITFENQVLSFDATCYIAFVYSYSFDIIGRTYSINSVNKAINSNGKKVLSLNSNELMQNTTTYKYPVDVDVSIINVSGKNYYVSIANALDYDLYVVVKYGLDTNTYKIVAGRTQSGPESFTSLFSHTPTITKKYRLLPISEFLSNMILTDYINGKETAELLCSISEYYNENGTLAISTKQDINNTTKATFAIGDIVVPYIFTTDGEKPMSKYKNETPKQFYVTATEIIFDGAIWQKLTLQEKTYGI